MLCGATFLLLLIHSCPQLVPTNTVVGFHMYFSTDVALFLVLRGLGSQTKAAKSVSALQNLFGDCIVVVGVPLIYDIHAEKKFNYAQTYDSIGDIFLNPVIVWCICVYPGIDRG